MGRDYRRKADARSRFGRGADKEGDLSPTRHSRNDYRQYTCYDCHEHMPDNIRREHIEEGIRDYTNCVKCHRNANEDDIRGGFGEGEGGGNTGRNKRDDD